MRVGGGQGDAGQAAGGQVAEERQPLGAVLGGGDLQAEEDVATTETAASARRRRSSNHPGK
jgi:hypothetical protein